MSDYLDKIAVGSTTYDIKDSNAYVLPSTGVPSSDMAADVQAALDSANSAYQKPGTGIPSSDLAAGVIPVVPTAYDTAAQALGTASAGTSTSWARGDHIHPMPSASDVGAVAAPTSASHGEVLAYNGSTWVPTKRTVILSYGKSTWAEFQSAYDANAVIYCRASSNTNPASGVQGRMAFMAYVNLSGTTPTSVEFQYYRSVSSHSVTQQGDQVYIYKLQSTGWSVTVREAYTKIDVGTGLASSYSDSALTITNPAAVPTGGTTGQALVKTSSSDYALAWQTIDVGHSIPSGGSNGQVLAKSSDDDYAVIWTTIHNVPAGGSTGQVLKKTSGTDYEVAWDDESCGITYTHIKWSDEQPTTDSAMSDTPSDWFGICVSASSAAPTHYTDYAWYKVKDGPTSIADGGTGATTKYEACENLGAMFLGSPQTAIPSNSDLDDYKTANSNLYVLNSTTAATILHAPTTSVGYKLIIMYATGGSNVRQIAIVNGGNEIYSRHYTRSAGTWTAWGRLLDTNDLPLSVANGGTGATTASGARENIGAVNVAGDIMTGNLFVAKAGNAYVQTENESTGVKLNLDTGSGINHGIYTYGYYDGGVFYSDPKWMIYRNGSRGIIVNGHSTDDFNLQQGTEIPKNSDLNDYITPGTYFVLSSTEAVTMSHGPITSTGYKLVVMIGSIANRRHQFAFVQASNTIYRRYYDGSTWGSWELALLSTDRGSSGNWRWVKRNDGTCDLYYQEAGFTADCSTAKGSIYVQSAQQTLTYPFTIYRGTASVDFYVNSNAYMTWATQIAAFESKLYYRLACSSSSSSLSGTFAVHIAGYWQNPG